MPKSLEQQIVEQITHLESLKRRGCSLEVRMHAAKHLESLEQQMADTPSTWDAPAYAIVDGEPVYTADAFTSACDALEHAGDTYTIQWPDGALWEHGPNGYYRKLNNA